jgi:arylsulfatase
MRATVKNLLYLVSAVLGAAAQGRAAAPGRSGTAAPADRPPNVVIILADDLGYADVGAFGARAYRTPNLDRLARDGMRFRRFYVAQPVCSASRAALLTGCYANRLGIHGALGPRAQHGINAAETTLAEVLKTRGYATAIYGKWHLGHLPEFLPTRHGFDDYFGLPYSNDMWPRHPTNRSFPELPLIELDRVVQTMPDQRQLTTWYTERAVKFVEANADRPFFLYVPHNMPHVPLHVSSKFDGKSGAGLYGDVIMEIDWSVGEILRALERKKIERETLVIFLSDNGPWLSYGTHAGSAGRLREGKGTTWEGGVRIPCIVRWPGRVPAGAVCREPAMTIDLLPTIAKLAGAALPALPIDGLDIGPLLTGAQGAKNPHDAYYFYFETNQLQAVLSGRWKLYLPHTYSSLAGKRGGDGGVPAVYTPVRMERELYDLEKDERERTNVAASHPDVVARLAAFVERARVDLGDSLTGRTGKNVREPGRVPVP